MIGALPTLPPALWRVAQLGFTVLLFALIWRATDGPMIVGLMAQAQPGWLLGAVGLLICQTILSAWRWTVTASALGQSLLLVHAVREYFLSQVINQALPGAVMGDAARAVRARHGVGLATSGLAVAMERLAGQIAMFATLVVAFTITLQWPGGLDWPASVALPVATILWGTTALIGCTLLAYRFGFFARVARWLHPAAQALWSPHVRAAQLALGAAITLCNLGAFGLCALAIGAPLSTAAVFAIVPLILFSMLIPLTVSGWGVREGSAALLLPIGGIAVPEAVAISALFGLCLLAAVLPGLVVAGMK